MHFNKNCSLFSQQKINYDYYIETVTPQFPISTLITKIMQRLNFLINFDYKSSIFFISLMISIPYNTIW